MIILVTFFVVILAIICYMLWDICGFGCEVHDNFKDSDLETDVILTNKLIYISVFGEPIKRIRTAGTKIQWLETKTFEIVFYITGRVTIRAIGDSSNKEFLLDKEHHIKELEKFKTNFFNKVKIGKTNSYKLKEKLNLEK